MDRFGRGRFGRRTPAAAAGEECGQPDRRERVGAAHRRGGWLLAGGAPLAVAGGVLVLADVGGGATLAALGALAAVGGLLLRRFAA